MKKMIFFAGLFSLFVFPLFSQNANSNEEVQDGPKAVWTSTTVDLGEVPSGTPKDAQFKLTNTGNKPLIITSARASCGCTNLKYTTDPLLPGESTTISATYNGSGSGNFKKSISVYTNTPESMTVLYITGNVVSKS